MAAPTSRPVPGPVPNDIHPDTVPPRGDRLPDRARTAGTLVDDTYKRPQAGVRGHPGRNFLSRLYGHLSSRPLDSGERNTVALIGIRCFAFGRLGEQSLGAVDSVGLRMDSSLGADGPPLVAALPKPPNQPYLWRLPILNRSNRGLHSVVVKQQCHGKPATTRAAEKM